MGGGGVLPDTSSNQFSGVVVKWFPKSADHGDILDFLVKFGLPEAHEAINIKENGQVIIENLAPQKCDQMCSSINGSKFKDKKNIYCQGIVAVTPDKANSLKVASVDQDMSSSLGKSSTIVTSNSNVHDAEFEFHELSTSKFFKKPTEVDSEDGADQYASDFEDWTLKKKIKKRKNNSTPTDNNQRLNSKTTPKTGNRK